MDHLASSLTISVQFKEKLYWILKKDDRTSTLKGIKITVFILHLSLLTRETLLNWQMDQYIRTSELKIANDRFELIRNFVYARIVTMRDRLTNIIVQQLLKKEKKPKKRELF